MSEKYEYMSMISLGMVKEKLPCRYKDSHKGTFGTMLCISGSRGMVGAGIFPVLAALKSGVGLVRAMMIKSLYEIVSKDVLEPIYIPLEENFEGTVCEKEISKINQNLCKCNSVVVGCGIGWNEDSKKIVEEVIKNSEVPVIIDADGINVISENINVLKCSKSDIILTPHIKEFSRLSGKSIDEINADKIQISTDFAKEYGATLVLKGHSTNVISKKGDVYVNPTGNAGMAKGGSGDVLAGMIGSFLAQKLSPLDAALCAVYLHGLCADRCAEKTSKTSMLPTDIINELPSLFTEIEK
ncbi:MAG: NAD(P)H-hydrate dehydratase [Oscillospiraceae bacterium]|jgi:NAD(P)H-hydrate epimerase|nr:NAD(P)H-hydrate dehydratase [Oscillospiraceae bacterium]